MRSDATNWCLVVPRRASADCTQPRHASSARIGAAREGAPPRTRVAVRRGALTVAEPPPVSSVCTAVRAGSPRASWRQAESSRPPALSPMSRPTAPLQRPTDAAGQSLRCGRSETQNRLSQRHMAERESSVVLFVLVFYGMKASRFATSAAAPGSTRPTRPSSAPVQSTTTQNPPAMMIVEGQDHSQSRD